MNTFCRAFAVSALALALTSGVTLAQDHPDPQAQDHQQYVKHTEWKKGAKINNDDWGRGQQVDWHAHKLRKPPAGYEWRQVDGNFVLANNDGLIFSVVVSH
jgi:Ni/Co efflux regulator RcnB